MGQCCCGCWGKLAPARDPLPNACQSLTSYGSKCEAPQRQRQRQQTRQGPGRRRGRRPSQDNERLPLRYLALSRHDLHLVIGSMEPLTFFVTYGYYGPGIFRSFFAKVSPHAMSSAEYLEHTFELSLLGGLLSPPTKDITHHRSSSVHRTCLQLRSD